MAGGAEDDGGGGRGAFFAFVFPVFVTVLPLSVLVLVRGVFVLFVLTAVLVFFPLVFTATAVMFRPFFRFLPIIYCQPLWKQKKQQISLMCNQALQHFIWVDDLEHLTNDFIFTKMLNHQFSLLK